MIPAVIAIIAILLIGTVGLILLHGRGTGSGGTAKASPTPKASARPSPSPSPTATSGLLPLPTFPPTANAPLTKVSICSPSAPCDLGKQYPPAKDTSCTLGGSCHIDFAAYWSGNTVTKLTFTIEFFDRCNNPGNTTTTLYQRTYSGVGQLSFDPTPRGGQKVTLPSGVKAAVIVVIADTGTVKAASPTLTPAGSADSCA
jgi:hypothetical protein